MGRMLAVLFITVRCAVKKHDFLHSSCFGVEANELVHIQLTVVILVETLKQQFHL